MAESSKVTPSQTYALTALKFYGDSLSDLSDILRRLGSQAAAALDDGKTLEPDRLHAQELLKSLLVIAEEVRLQDPVPPEEIIRNLAWGEKIALTDGETQSLKKCLEASVKNCDKADRELGKIAVACSNMSHDNPMRLAAPGVETPAHGPGPELQSFIRTLFQKYQCARIEEDQELRTLLGLDQA